MKASRIYAFLIFRLFFLGGFACLTPPNSFAQTLPPKEIESSVAKIAALVEENYVFAEKGRKIAAHFSSEHRRGIFKNAKDWQEFSAQATEVLRTFSGDGHLFVRYDPQQVKELNAPQTDRSEVDSSSENSFFHSLKARERNYGLTKIEILERNIGYLKLSEINLSEKSLPVLTAAMRFVANTKALVIDLRDNGGGGSEIGAVLESFFLPKSVALLEFRNRAGAIETSRTVAWLTENKYDAPLYIIVNRKTASAAEAFAYAMQGKKRAAIVGQPSAGAAHMSSWYPVNEYLYVSVSTAAPVLTGTENSWEGTGVQPDFVTAAGQELEFVRGRINGK